jgi:hypothetical protein
MLPGHRIIRILLYEVKNTPPHILHVCSCKPHSCRASAALGSSIVVVRDCPGSRMVKEQAHVIGGIVDPCVARGSDLTTIRAIFVWGLSDLSSFSICYYVNR